MSEKNNIEAVKEKTFCKKCGTELSSDQMFCSKCGTPVKMICSNCQTILEEEQEFCPNCGKSIKESETVSKSEIINFSKLKNNINYKVIVLVALAVALVFGGFAYSKSQKEEKFKSAYKSAVSTMLSGAANAEKAAALTHDVWKNSIEKNADPATNPYTFKDEYRNNPNYTNETTARKSYFNEDFNDSLNNLFNNWRFDSQISSIQSNQRSVKDYMTILNDVPKGYENAYSAIDNLYTQYLGITNLALNPTGSLVSYTSDFNSYDSAFSNAYSKASSFSENY